MDINDLTIGQVKKLLSIFNMQGCVTQNFEPSSNEKTLLSNFAIGKNVIIRTYSAGVFVGTLKSRYGKEAIIENSRRIWSWSGAFTLSEIAEAGLDNAKMAVIEPEKLVTECIEIILCTDIAYKKIMEIKSHE